MGGKPMEKEENSIDVTSSAFGTLPSGLSVAYADLHKATKCGHMITATIALDRTSSYVSATRFNYIKAGFRPKQRIYATGMDNNRGVTVTVVIYTDGQMSLVFSDDSATAAYLSVTYPIY